MNHLHNTFCVVLVFFLVYGAQAQALKHIDQELVPITHHLIDNKHVFVFENQRKTMPIEKIPIFCSRIEQMSNKLASAEYDNDSDNFTLRFVGDFPSEDELKGVLSHFNIYNYELIQQ